MLINYSMQLPTNSWSVHCNGSRLDRYALPNAKLDYNNFSLIRYSMEPIDSVRDSDADAAAGVKLKADRKLEHNKTEAPIETNVKRPKLENFLKYTYILKFRIFSTI